MIVSVMSWYIAFCGYSHHITSLITSHHSSFIIHHSSFITSLITSHHSSLITSLIIHHSSHHNHHITSHYSSHHITHHITSHYSSLITSHHITSHHITHHSSLITSHHITYTKHITHHSSLITSHHPHYSPHPVRHLPLREDRPHRVGPQLRAPAPQAQHPAHAPRPALLQQDRHPAPARLQARAGLLQQGPEGPRSADLLRRHHAGVRAAPPRVAAAGLPCGGRVAPRQGVVHADHGGVVYDGLYILAVELLGPLHVT